MMETEYIQINLNDIIEGIGENQTKAILSSFSCPLNPDVEDFLHSKAIEFSKRGFAKTHLVFWTTSDRSERELVGYYSIAPKTFTISRDDISKNQYKKICQYGEFDQIRKKTLIPSILIGQLGKNYTDGNDTLIKGDELLYLALEKVKSIQEDLGGRYTYLECEDNQKLINFYESNGFIPFGKRSLDPDETNIHGAYLIQLLKKI